MSQFEKLLKEFNLELPEKFRQGRITKHKFHKESSSFDFTVEFDEVHDFNETEQLKNLIETKLHSHFNSIICNFNFNLNKYSQNKFNTHFNNALKVIKSPQLNEALRFCALEIDDTNSKIKLTLKNKKDFNLCLSHKNIIEDQLKKQGIKNPVLDIEFINEEAVPNFNLNKNEIRNIISQYKPSETQSQYSSYKGSSSRSYSKREYQPLTLKDFQDSNEEHVELMGDVFEITSRKLANNNERYSILITDYQEAAELIYFAKNDESKIKDIKIGDCIKVYGTVKVINEKLKNVTFNRFEKCEPLFKDRYDEASEKHTELNFHTKMSTMDGILSPKEIVNQALKFNHPVIGIADTNSVQSFPEFYHLTKKNENLKVVYGASVSTYKDGNGVFIQYDPQKDNINLKDHTYVTFDFETTGLSPIEDEIIEFGAVLIKDNKIAKKESFFVKSSKKISSKITNITGITQSQSDRGETLENALIKIKNFFADHVIIAHNAPFDYNFLVEKANKFNIKFDNVFIDSVATSHLATEFSRGFTLGMVAARAGVIYNEEEAHRADYDAEVLAKIWMQQVSSFSRLNVLTFSELNQYTNKTVFERKRPYDISIWVKNQKGLKELYKIISKLNTTYFYNEAKYPFEKLDRTDNLFFSSGGVAGPMINSLISENEVNVKKMIDKFDYIEIPPFSGMSHLFNKYGASEIKSLLKKLVDWSLEKNKKIIASAQPRYLSPESKIVHEIYIEATGIKNKRHKLFFKRNSYDSYPDQHYFTTKELMNEYSFLGSDYQEIVKKMVIDNPRELASKIDKLQIIPDKLFAPIFDDSAVKLEKMVYENAYKQYGNPLPKIVEKRLQDELKPILKYGFDVIYWISSKLVNKSLEDGYLVGSRGSVGSSLVATMAKITEVNPLQPHYYCKNCKYSEFPETFLTNSGYDLDDKNCPRCSFKLDKDGQTIPFATFLGFEADKTPDIDLNFSGEYQSIIHEEVRNIFGEDHSFRAGTISKVASKTAYGYVLNHFKDKEKVSDAYIRFLMTKAIDVKRTTGQHPGGIIIIPKEYDVEDFTPINYPADDESVGWKTTHFDFKAIHDNLLKLDLLGHDDPTALKMLSRITGVDLFEIPKKDDKVISIFSSPLALGIKPEDILNEPTGALGIPEFGTPFVRKMLTAVNVKSFSDLVSVSGLSHGEDVWLGNAEQLIKRGSSLKDVTSCRDDIMIRLIELGVNQKLAFNIMEQVRKGKGLTDEQKKEIRKHGATPGYIENLVKIKYLFPKAHATAYVIMAWRVAYFKVYYPLEYYATYFTTRANDFDIKVMISGNQAIKEKINQLENQEKLLGKALSTKDDSILQTLYLAQEAAARGIKISTIDLEKSAAKEWLFDKETNTLIPPFVTVNSLGESIANKIVEARRQKPFISFEDFKKRSGATQTIAETLHDINVFKDIDIENQNTLW
ncbi:PolC-type DNA polymerase III [Mycoplasmopsis agassizii]|uniref:PolC-type DNA polymerase III n=1 Tax=Mycoplasmopsis agassizii TaxID=33922 RepID=UPI003528409D